MDQRAGKVCRGGIVMFFGKLNSISIKRRINNMHPIVFLPVFIAIIIVFSNCSASKGSIVILENPDGTGFTMDFKQVEFKKQMRIIP